MRSVEYRALEDDCVALVGVINALGGIIDALAREWPEGAALPDDTLERLEHVDQRMDDIYARRQEWRV